MPTTDRQVVNGQTYMIMDSQARQDVTDLKSALSYITEGSINLLDPNAAGVTRGTYIDRDGTVKTNANISQSDYIRVVPGADYTAEPIQGFVLWFNTNKEKIGQVSSEVFVNDGFVTVPAGVAYAKFLFTTASIDSAWVAEGRVVRALSISSNAGAVVYNDYQSLNDAEKAQARNNIGAEESGIFIKSKNLFNPDDLDYLIGRYYNTSGELITNENINQTGFINVIPGEKYTANYIEGFVLWYNSAKTLIGNSSSVVFVENGYVTAPINAAYARFIITSAKSFVFQVEHGESPTSFMTYGAKYRKTDYVDKKGVAFGTSLTYRALTTGGYLQVLPGMSGTTIDNQGIGSGTILYNSEVGAEKDILACIKRYNDYSDKDFCILEGFVNDWVSNADSLGSWTDATETTVCGCVRSAINYILTQNQSITLILVIDHYGQQNCASIEPNSEGITQYMYYEEIAKVAESIGIPIIHQNKKSGINEKTPQYLLDNIHLNTYGAIQSAETIWSEMRNIPVKK